MALDPSTVAHIAHLARIRVSAEEREKLAGELSRILTWIEQLNEVDTETVAPMTSAVEVALPWRRDEVTDGDCADKVMANAPDPAHGFFTVPKVVE